MDWVLVGFCGGGGTPLFSAAERDTDILWFLPQSEYRPTEYLQAWVGFWFEDAARLAAAKVMQNARIALLRKHWLKERGFVDSGFAISPSQLEPILLVATDNIMASNDVNELLTAEARLTKQLFKLAAQAVNYGEFLRAKRGTGSDPANRFLDHGNYLAYGLGATATWVLGLPHGLAVLHGKTRRGGLVFDAADLIKDALIMPQAFLSAAQGDDEQEFRKAAIDVLARAEALDLIIDTLKQIALTTENGRP